MKALGSIALGFGLLFVATVANAQGVNVKANIPFDFVAGNQALPAGQYVISPAPGVLMIRSSDGSKSAISTTQNWGGGDRLEKTELVFHHIGKTYFLSQVKVEGFAEGRQLPKSRTESEAEVASNQKPEQVVIVAGVVNK
jgi:hypothetical protein